MKYLSLIILSLIVSSCAMQPQGVWVTDDPAHHDWNKDRFACMQQSSTAAPPATGFTRDMFGDPMSYDINKENRDNMLVACLNARDWNFVVPTVVNQ